MSADDATIHLSVPKATKARWVRESRAAGMRLTDWIIDRVEARNMSTHTTIRVPTDLQFADLKLARAADGDVSFDSGVISRIEAASGLPTGHFMSQSEVAVADLIVQWYRAHLATGGASDPVAADLVAEARIEDERGGGLSHQPGRA